jgi:hypothetical protein
VSTERAATPALWAGATIVVVALLGLLGWQYLMPADFASDWTLNHDGVDRFRALYHVGAAPLSREAYRTGFRALLLAAFGGYLLLGVAGLQGGRLPARVGTLATVALAVAFALAWPPALSRDVYRYVGYARMAAVHHLNPYAAARDDLIALGDPAGPFMAPAMASPYGPLWMWLSIATVSVLRGAGFVAQVVAIKLLAAAALIALARLGRALAQRLRAGRGDLAAVMIGLNPLFLIEGPGSGHNDLVMAALLMGGLVAFAQTRMRASALLVGGAVAVKFIPAIVVPWLIISRARALWPDRRRALIAAATFGLLALLPLVVTYAPLWHAGGVLSGLGVRLLRGQQQAHGTLLAGVAASIGVAAATLLVLVRADLPHIVTAWVLAALVVMLTVSGVWFPWYLVWLWPFLLTRWDRGHVALSGAVLAFAIFLMLIYSISTVLSGGY